MWQRIDLVRLAEYIETFYVKRAGKVMNAHWKWKFYLNGTQLFQYDYCKAQKYFSSKIALKQLFSGKMEKHIFCDAKTSAFVLLLDSKSKHY